MGDDPNREFNAERIKTLTQTAKGVWFGYLGALAFTGITLLGVKDVDFFKLDSSTELPLVGVSVPVTSFFGAGSLLLATIYCYLHVFLEQLWVELSDAPARLGHDGKPIEIPDRLTPKERKELIRNSTPIGRHVHPWLISEYALLRRLKLKDEPLPPIERSYLGEFGIVSASLLGWLAGPCVLFFFWLWSHPAPQLSAYVFLCSRALGIHLGNDGEPSFFKPKNDIEKRGKHRQR